jgi:hypothetical protein
MKFVMNDTADECNFWWMIYIMYDTSWTTIKIYHHWSRKNQTIIPSKKGGKVVGVWSLQWCSDFHIEFQPNIDLTKVSLV